MRAFWVAGDLERGEDIVLSLPCTPEVVAAVEPSSVLELHLDRRLELYSYAPHEGHLRNAHALDAATREPVTPQVSEICGAG